MKQLAYILLLFSLPVFSTTTQISTTDTESDIQTALTGASAGDSILLERGGHWRECNLLLEVTGTISDTVYIGNYGTGAKPILSGYKQLGTWTDDGDGTWIGSYTGVGPWI